VNWLPDEWTQGKDIDVLPEKTAVEAWAPEDVAKAENTALTNVVAEGVSQGVDTAVTVEQTAAIVPSGLGTYLLLGGVVALIGYAGYKIYKGRK
jgi:hypothetical protein